MRPQPQDRAQNFPLPVTVVLRRELAHVSERGAKFFVRSEHFEQCQRAVFPGLPRWARRKAFVLGELLAPPVLVSEQYAGTHRPAFDTAGEGSVAEIAEGVLGERLQFRPRLRRNQAAHALEDRVPGFLQRRLQFRALPAMPVTQPMA